MQRIFNNYLEREHYKNGLFNLYEPNEQLIELCCGLLSDTNELYKAMYEVVNQRPWCVSYFMSNTANNRQSFLGRAACNKRFKCCENDVRIAWYRLTKTEKEEANQVANDIITYWTNYLYELQMIKCQKYISQ